MEYASIEYQLKDAAEEPDTPPKKKHVDAGMYMRSGDQVTLFTNLPQPCSQTSPAFTVFHFVY